MSATLRPVGPSRPRRDLACGCVLAAVVLLLALPVLGLVLYLPLNFVVQTVHVIGPAMEPAVRNGDYLVADKLAYRRHPPARGDIVILRDPFDPGKDLIKRVVGLPGERVLVAACAVSVDGRRLPEPYVRAWSVCDPPWPADGQPATLALDEFFLMGDNRDRSMDSRQIGPIRRSQIESRAWFRALPLVRG
ncbi:MAG TPA: signal peptidase I [Terriglobales bacterium]|nr:signal peptidase I [Terriglobales bacterium]